MGGHRDRAVRSGSAYPLHFCPTRTGSQGKMAAAEFHWVQAGAGSFCRGRSHVPAAPSPRPLPRKPPEMATDIRTPQTRRPIICASYRRRSRPSPPMPIQAEHFNTPRRCGAAVWVMSSRSSDTRPFPSERVDATSSRPSLRGGYSKIFHAAPMAPPTCPAE